MLIVIAIAAVVVLLILLWALKPAFTRLRSAIELVARIETLEGTVQSLQFEWTDTLDKLLAREERWRKRYKAEVNGVLEVPTPQPVEHPQSSRDVKGTLRARLGAIRTQSG